MEKIQNTIENSDNSKRFENIQEEMLFYQFQYVEKIDKGILKPLEIKKENNEVSSFKELIYRDTYFRQYLTDQYQLRCEKSIYGNSGEMTKFDQWLDSVLEEIKNKYESGDKKWANNINEIFKVKLEQIGSIQENKKESFNDKKERVGLINFNITSGIKELEKYGINKNEKCLFIHFDSLIDQKNKDNSIANIFSGDSLSKLAIKIVDEHPEIKAVLAYSWLVDSPIGKRIGFQIFNKHIEATQYDSFWGQFINEKGEINKERIKRFLETGVPDFYVSEGFIEIKDFLRKYLPKERGKIVHLMNLSEESLIFNKDMNRLSEQLNNNWENLSFDEIVSLVNSNKILEKYFKTEDGQKYLEMTKKMKEIGIKRSETFSYPGREELQEKLSQYINENSSRGVLEEVSIE